MKTQIKIVTNALFTAAMVCVAALAMGSALPLLAVGAGAFALSGGAQVLESKLQPFGSVSVCAISSLQDVLWEDGGDNMGGIQTIAYYCLHSDFDVHPAPLSREDATTLDQLVQVSNTPTFKSGKGWKKMYVTEDTGMVESAQQGERDGKSFYNKIGGFHPGSRIKFLGWARYVNNSGLYGMGLDAEGERRLVGTFGYPAKIDVMNISTETTAAGRKGTTFEMGCSANHPALFFPDTTTLDLESSSGSI